MQKVLTYPHFLFYFCKRTRLCVTHRSTHRNPKNKIIDVKNFEQYYQETFIRDSKIWYLLLKLQKNWSCIVKNLVLNFLKTSTSSDIHYNNYRIVQKIEYINGIVQKIEFF